MKTIIRYCAIFSMVILCSCDSDDDTVSNDPIPEIIVEFTEHTQQDQMGDFAENAMAEFNGYVWSTGGYNDYNTGRSWDVWKSSNGIAWVSVTEAQFEPRSNHTLTVFDGKMWLIGGIDNTDTFLGDVYF
ncbi:kelch repeat-containing protein, partial [Psychroserpens sp.]|uniref:kelch repeat-containing protein n=1 Tax=Psychroserpens sp. TaxID=2020870 RepID=UPI003C7591B8